MKKLNLLIAAMVTTAFCIPLVGVAEETSTDPYAPVVEENGQVSVAMDPMKSAHVIIRVRNPDGSFSTEEVIGIEAAQERLTGGTSNTTSEVN